MKEIVSKIFKSAEAATLYILIPADLVKDSTFPLDGDGQKVRIRIEGKRLVIEAEVEGKT